MYNYADVEIMASDAGNNTQGTVGQPRFFNLPPVSPKCAPEGAYGDQGQTKDCRGVGRESGYQDYGPTDGLHIPGPDNLEGRPFFQLPFLEQIPPGDTRDPRGRGRGDWQWSQQDTQWHVEPWGEYAGRTIKQGIPVNPNVWNPDTSDPYPSQIETGKGNPLGACTLRSDGYCQTIYDDPNDKLCRDEIWENTQYTCEDHAGWGQCDEDFMEGWCLRTCNKCPQAASAKGKQAKDSGVCEDAFWDDTPYTCEDHKQWGQCDDDFMEGFCRKTCGKCSSSSYSNRNNRGTSGGGGGSRSSRSSSSSSGGGSSGGGNDKSSGECTDEFFDDNPYTCDDFKRWGQCNERFMWGKCRKTCGKCTTVRSTGDDK